MANLESVEGEWDSMGVEWEIGMWDGWVLMELFDLLMISSEAY